MRLFIMFTMRHLEILTAFFLYLNRFVIFPPVWAYWAIMKCGYLWFIFFSFSYALFFWLSSSVFLWVVWVHGIMGTTMWLWQRRVSKCYWDLGLEFGKREQAQWLWWLVFHGKSELWSIEYGSYGAFEHGPMIESEIWNAKKSTWILHQSKWWSRYH